MDSSKFVGNANGPYTLAWGNHQEPMNIDGLTILDHDLDEAYPPAEEIEIESINISGGKIRPGGKAGGFQIEANYD